MTPDPDPCLRPAARAALEKLTGRTGAIALGRAAAGIWAALCLLTTDARPFVLIPANTCYIVLWAVLRAGRIPRLVDIDPATGQITPETLQAAGDAGASVVVPCHLYGIGAPIAAICAWAAARGIAVIEDAAQAAGARVDGGAAGGWGACAVLSFGLGKGVDLGLGGALMSDDATFLREARRLLDCDAPPLDEAGLAALNQWNDVYWALHQHEMSAPGLAALYPRLFGLYGRNLLYSLARADYDDLAPAISRLTRQNRQRAAIAARYRDNLIGRGWPLATLAARDDADNHPAWWRWPLLVTSGEADNPTPRDALLRHLWGAGFHEAARWYPSLAPMLAALVPEAAIAPTPHADRLAAQVINLPWTRAAHVTAAVTGCYL